MNVRGRVTLLAALTWFAAPPAGAGDWPTVHHDPARTGCTGDDLRPPVAVAWKRSFKDGPIATCVEPIVAGGKVYVGSMNGKLYAVNAADGSHAWTFETGGPILHSPACAEGKVYVGSVDGHLYCLDASTGRRQWRFFGGRGGFAASPAAIGGVVYAGSRSGTFYAVRDEGGEAAEIWRFEAGAPIWQTAAVARGKVYFMAEDMIARALDAAGGTVVWESRRVAGCQARDYYPCVIGDHVAFRTRPADGAESPIHDGNKVLARASGYGDDLDDAEAREIHQLNVKGVPQGKIDGEAEAINDFFVNQRPNHRTFYVFHADSGAEVAAPVLWLGGCGGVPPPPAMTRDGSCIVGWRSLYTGWLSGSWRDYFGSSPRFGLGKIDLAAGRMSRIPPEPVGGRPWGLFTIADEHSAIQVGGDYVYIVHQGSVCAFNLATRKIAVLLAARDTWGGVKCLDWAGNEWHGPARGGLAIAGDRAYWVVGSNLICLAEK